MTMENPDRPLEALDEPGAWADARSRVVERRLRGLRPPKGSDAKDGRARDLLPALRPQHAHRARRADVVAAHGGVVLPAGEVVAVPDGRHAGREWSTGAVPRPGAAGRDHRAVPPDIKLTANMTDVRCDEADRAQSGPLYTERSRAAGVHRHDRRGGADRRDRQLQLRRGWRRPVPRAADVGHARQHDHAGLPHAVRGAVRDGHRQHLQRDDIVEREVPGDRPAVSRHRTTDRG